MPNIIEVTVGVLEPFVGRTVADTCVRATALSCGKLTDELVAEDLPAVEASVRRLLGPIASSSAIDEIVQEIRTGVTR